MRNWKTLSSGTIKVRRLESQITFSLGHCVVCSSSTYDYDCPFGIFKLFLFKSL